MNELISLIRQILNDGLTIEVHIRRESQTVRPSPAQPEKFIARCDWCDWHGAYDNEMQAAKALRSHHQHCAARTEAHGWLNDLESSRD